MDVLNNLYMGFGVAMTLTNLGYCFIGVLLGTLIGVLPGVGPLVKGDVCVVSIAGLGSVTTTIAAN